MSNPVKSQITLEPQRVQSMKAVGNSAQSNYNLKNRKDKQLDHYLRMLMYTLEKYSESISHSNTYSLSDGHWEGINNKIKTIKRSG